MSSQTVQDWQLNKKSVQERNACMFNNAEMSDIQLSCGETSKVVFNSHKYVLATSSPVFHTMFYGSFPETKSVIHLPDSDEDGLEAFLRYLYKDETPNTPELALKVMYLAHKYMITALTQECVKVAKANISPQNAILVLTAATLVEEGTLVESAWKVVDSETRAVLASEGFNEISASLLCELLKRDSLRISEVELFKAVVKWSDIQCTKRCMQITGENRRSVLGDGIYHLRFLVMSQQEFVETVIPTGLLESEISLSILQKFLGFNLAPSFRWPVTKKRSDYLRWPRFDETNVRAPSSTWKYLYGLVMQTFNGNWPDSYFSWDYSRPGRSDYLEFRLVNSSRENYAELKAIMFHGVRLFGDSSGSTYHVTMKLGEDEAGTRMKAGENRDVSDSGKDHVISGTHCGTYTSESTSDMAYGFDVVLAKPLRIKLHPRYCWNPNTPRYSGPSESSWQMIKLTITGPRSFYGDGGKKTVKMCEHNSVEFRNLYRTQSNNTNVTSGQIVQILVTPCQPCEACNTNELSAFSSSSKNGVAIPNYQLIKIQ